MNIKAKIKKHRFIILSFSIYVLLFSFLIAYSLNFDFSQIVDGGDTDAYLNPFLAIKKGFYIWEDSVFGRINLMSFIQILYAMPLAILSTFIPLTYTQFIYWVLLFSFIPFSFYLLSSYFTKNTYISFFSGILYSLNLFTAIIHHTPVYHLLYLQGATPLLFFFSFKLVESKKILNYLTVLFSIVYLPLLRVINMYAIYLILIPIFSYITVKFYKKINIDYKFFLKKMLIIGVIVLLLSSPYFITLITSYSSQITQSDPNVEFSEISVESSKIHANLLNILRLTTTYGWETEEFWTEVSGIQGFDAAKIYHTNATLIFLTFYPILLACLVFLIIFYKIDQVKKKFLTFLLTFTLIFLFLAKMINPPFGGINNFLYKNFNFFLILFRSAWEYMQIPYLIMLCVLITVGLNEVALKYIKKRKMFIVVAVILLLVHTAYIAPAIVVDSKLINKTWIVEIPQEYYDVANFLNEQEDNFRILPLPLSKHFTGYTSFDWGYSGPDILYRLLDKASVDKYHNPVLSSRQLELISYIEQLSHTNLKELLEQARRLNVKYILLRNDVNNSHMYIKTWNDPAILFKSLNSMKEIKDKFVFGNLTLYELEPFPRVSIITNTSQRTEKVPYLFIDNNNSLSLSYNEGFGKVDTLSLRVSFLLNKTVVENESDWLKINQRVIISNMFKISISQYGTAWVFLYTSNNSFESYVLDLEGENLTNKKINLELNLNHDQIEIIKDGFLYSFVLNESLGHNLTFIQFGGEIDAEKMVGNLYNVSLMINDITIPVFENLIDKYPETIMYDEHNLTGENIDIYELLSDGTLSIIQDIDLVTSNVESYMVDSSEYVIHLNASSPFMLCFAESYDNNWEATVNYGGEKIEMIPSQPLFSVLNGFWINKTGNIEITLKYQPQRWFEIGMIISFLILLVCIGYSTYDKIKDTSKIASIRKKIFNIFQRKR